MRKGEEWGWGKSSFISFVCGEVGRRKEKCVFVHVLLHTCAEARGGVGALLNHFLPNSLKTGSLTETGACFFSARLAGSSSITPLLGL